MPTNDQRVIVCKTLARWSAEENADNQVDFGKVWCEISVRLNDLMTASS